MPTFCELMKAQLDKDMRPAMQMAVYETFEDIYGRKSTLDELIAGVSQFTQKSMLWVCATIVAGMQLWNRVDEQPGGVFSTLVELYFDAPLRGRLLAGYWSGNPRRVLFHRRQLLLIAKLAIKHCSGSGVDARQNANLIGDILLKANDQLDFGLLRELAVRGSLPATRDEYSKLVAELVVSGEDGSPQIAQMITRSHLMLRRFANELCSHPDWIDIVGEYETSTGITLEENEAMIFGAHARHGQDLSRMLYSTPGALPLKEVNFAPTSIPPAKVSAFLDSLSSGPFKMAQELTFKDNGPNDLSIFRKYPLVLQFYNLHLKSAWCGFLMMDNIFFLDKVLTGPYWHANAKYGQRVHRFWGAVFERYVNELMDKATMGTVNQYIADPRPSNNPNEQLCDGVLTSGNSLVLMEYKGNVFTATAKYGGDQAVMTAEIQKKFVRVQESGTKKGVEQLAAAVKSLFSPDGARLYPQIDLKSIKHVYLSLVSLDSIGGTIGMSALLNTFLDELLDRSQFPSVEIHPLFCSEIEALEEITGLFKILPLPKILDRWQSAGGRMLLPLQAVDLARIEWGENEWLLAEWNLIYENMVRILFPNQDTGELMKASAIRASARISRSRPN